MSCIPYCIYDLAAKGEKILSGDFGDVKKYFKSLLPGEYTLVATPEGQVSVLRKVIWEKHHWSLPHGMGMVWLERGVMGLVNLI